MKFSSRTDVFLVNLDCNTERKRGSGDTRILLSSLLVSLVLIVETPVSKTDFCLPPRPLESSSNKQGNKIQVLRILPFPACFPPSIPLSFPAASRELVRAFFSFFFFVRFRPLPFEPCSLFSSGWDRLPPARRAIYYPTALPQTLDCLAPFSIS